MTARQRGQPLIFLAMIMVLWIGARIFAWTQPTPERPIAALAETPPLAPHPGTWAGNAPANRLLATPSLAPQRSVTLGRPLLFPAAPRTSVADRAAVVAGASLVREHSRMAFARDEKGWASPPPSPAPRDRQTEVTVLPGLGRGPDAGKRRWSGDAWILVRGGSGSGAAGLGVATYGGSQAGAVLRYGLAPHSAHRPTAYVRVTAALNGSGEREAALGLSARPLAVVPIVVAAEGRVGLLSGRTIARPAIMAITEIPPIGLPGKARAEVYAQAGYVGGAGATPFADAQLRIDRRVALAGPLELRAGAGAWAGGQRGAARFDTGLGFTVGAAKGPAAVRLSLDWRFRIAGAAEPASGPVLTVSAGF